MKYLALALFLILCTPSAPVAGPFPDGAVLLARGNGDGHRSGPGTVVITGRDGKVTGVEKRPGEKNRDQNRDQDRDQDRDQAGPGHSPGKRPK